MAESSERVCVGCGDTEDQAHLEHCPICMRWYCADCAHRAGQGRRFCSADCARTYYFGDADDDEADPDE